MNIRQFTIKNVRSFGETVTVDFDDGLNILIGPNGGGKSNLLDILNVVLCHFFIFNWHIVEDFAPDGTLRRRYFQRENVFNPQELLDKHMKKVQEDQEIILSFLVESEDILNMRNILNFSEKLKTFEKEHFGSSLFQDNFLVDMDTTLIESLSGIRSSFSIKNLELNIANQSSEEGKRLSLFLRYLNSFELCQLLIGEYNLQNNDQIPLLYPPFCYFSPYRISQIQAIIAKIAEVDFYQLNLLNKRSNSRQISTVIELAAHYFARKLRRYNNDLRRFNNDDEVRLVREYIQQLGYSDFIPKEEDPYKNRYRFIIKKTSGDELDLIRASSGEKEIFNILLGIFALNIKNGIVIIDEPELHLHPKWQLILLNLFYSLTNERGIQWIIVTHSPHLINTQSVKNVLRVYRDDLQNSRVVKPAAFSEDERDLFLMVTLTNSTKIFFSEKVVLVEGMVDRIIYSAIIEREQKENNDQQVIEILDVQEFGGFEKNQNFLDKWSIKSFIIADQDKQALPNLQDAFFLQNREIEEYFQSVVNKPKYKTDDALIIANKIKNGEVSVPTEIDSYCGLIISR